jgi:7-dehydrocholesterol reductase
VLDLSWPAVAAWLALAVFCIFLNYDADMQRHVVRAALTKAKGDASKVLVWGRPVVAIRAPYVDAAGKGHVNELIASGYYGLVRHFHYLPDIVLLFLYCAPAGFTRLLPFTYFFYLTSLLVDRCQRIDGRCLAKYGVAWEEYVRRVPYKLVPGVF